MKAVSVGLISLLYVCLASGKSYNLQPQTYYTYPSQPGYLNPVQTGYVNPSQPGYGSPLQTGYVNPSQPGYVNPLQTGYYNPLQTSYLNPASTSSLLTPGQTAGFYSPYASAFPYSPAFHYAPGINSQLLNPAVSQDQASKFNLKDLTPSPLTKSHVQFKTPSTLTKSHVQFNLQNVGSPLPSNLRNILAPSGGVFYPHHIQQSLARSSCSTCSCVTDYGCSFNCEKCSALCHSCSCEESQGCSYNCDKCQNSDEIRNADSESTTEEPTDDTTAATGEVDANTDAPVTSNTEDAGAVTEASVTEPASEDGATEPASEGGVTEPASVESVTGGEDVDTTEGEEDGVASSTEAGEVAVQTTEQTTSGGVVNPTFPLNSVGDSGNNGLVNPTFPLGGVSPLGETGGSESGDSSGNGQNSGEGQNSVDGQNSGDGQNSDSNCASLESLNLCSWGPSCQAVVNEVYPNCNYNCTSCEINQPGTCVASSGSAAGQTCVFPFKYNGVQYNGCAPLHSENRVLDFWCSTKTDRNGYHITGGSGDPGKYVGFCDSSCPRDIPGFRIQE